MTAQNGVNWDKADPEIEYKGRAITLPELPDKMPTREAIRALQRKAEAEEEIMTVHETIDGYPEDALVAINKAMKQLFGWANAVPTPGMFGKMPPELITVKTSVNTQVQVPYGRFTLPGVENPVSLRRHWTPEGGCIIIAGEVRKRENAVVLELANAAREILRNESIYRGKAIRLKADSDGDADFGSGLDYIDTSAIKPGELILNPDELAQIEAGLWAPIQHTDNCRKHGVPLNRGVLLEGTYGTGKTLTATVTGRICEENDWTFILLDDVRALKQALLFAQRYQPAVVFAEDVDRVASDRDQKGNDLLNTIDGALTKHAEVITVMTTNHVERLDRAMLRPGRLDAVVTVRPPEAEAVERLIRLYARSTLDPKVSLAGVSEQLAGNIPATIREVVERAKLAMLVNGREAITEEELQVCATGMQRHLELLAEPKPESTPEQRLGESMREVIMGGVSGQELTNALANTVGVLLGHGKHVEATVENLQETVTDSGADLADRISDVQSTADDIYSEVS